MTFLLARGGDFVRLVICKAAAAAQGAQLSEQRQAELAFAAKRWGDRSATVATIRTAVPGASAGGWGSELTDDAAAAAVEFYALAAQGTILARLEGLRRVPRRVPFVAISSGATAYWRGAGKATPVSRMAFDRDTLDTLGMGCLVVLPAELIKDSSAEAESLIRADLLRAVTTLLDSTFIDPTNAGSPGATPRSVTYAAPTLTSSGDLADDVEEALGKFAGSLATASWVMNPKTAALIGIRAGGRGVGADVGARGGVMAGLPVIVSESCAHDSDAGTIALVDGGGIILAEEPGIAVSTTDTATIEQDDSPAGATDTPVAASATLVSLWQSDSVGVKAVVRANWAKARAGSVVVITGAAYPAA